MRKEGFCGGFLFCFVFLEEGKALQNPQTRVPLSQPSGHLPGLGLSFNLEPQCFLESLPGRGSALGRARVPTWRELGGGASSCPAFPSSLPEVTETLKACRFDIVPTFQLPCELRLLLRSGGRREPGPLLTQPPGAPRGRGSSPDRQAAAAHSLAPAPARWDTAPR